MESVLEGAFFLPHLHIRVENRFKYAGKHIQTHLHIETTLRELILICML